MYRSYFLKNGFWSKKGNNNDNTAEKVFIKHDQFVGPIYATITNVNRKGVKLVVNRKQYFFNNFDKLDAFFEHLNTQQGEFKKILKRLQRKNNLATLDLDH